VFKSITIAIILAISALQVEASAFAQQARFAPGTDFRMMRLVQDASRFPVQPSQAAVAAQSAYPGSTVLGVKLLPNGEYAVTLKVGGSVQRVMVNATNGQVS
jgi:uncharacterized membrane protein YkoI